MSILTKPLFGRAPDSTPLTPVGVRCARLRMSTAIEKVQVAMFATILAQAVTFADLAVLFLFRGSRVAGPRSFLDDVWRLIRGFGPSSIAAVVLFYIGASFVIPRTARWAFDRSANLTRERSRRERNARRNMSVVHRCLVPVAIVLVVVSFALAVPGGVAVTAVVAAIAGSFLIAIGLSNRRGVRKVCARCDYPMSTWRGSPDRCPECGTPWKEPWRARLGVRERRPRLIALGAGMIATSIAIAAIGAMAM